MTTYPNPHGAKLRSLLENERLPEADRPRVKRAVERYDRWLDDLVAAGSDVGRLVSCADAYRRSVTLDLIFDSTEDFLYRQKGQLKLDNSVLEEFLPRLVGQVFSDEISGLAVTVGPATVFSRLRFESDLATRIPGGGMEVMAKDHDFALCRPLYLKASHEEDYTGARESRTNIAYLAAEIKTNLDKTMFQEASATARDLRMAMPGSRYLLLCEWLDMTPIASVGTAIEEVIVLRKAKRLSAEVRRQFATAAGRIASREMYEDRLRSHPLAADAFRRFLKHVGRLLGEGPPAEEQVLERGWF